MYWRSELEALTPALRLQLRCSRTAGRFSSQELREQLTKLPKEAEMRDLDL